MGSRWDQRGEKMIANIDVAENGSLDQRENRELPSLNYVNIKRTGVIPEAQYGDHLKNYTWVEEIAPCLKHLLHKPDSLSSDSPNHVEARDSRASVCNPAHAHGRREVETGE